jgi:uncharacterized membrane-anchored protein
MILIRDVVQEALSTGYLSVAAEDQLRQMLKSKHGLVDEDFQAFIALQEAAMSGRIQQESHVLLHQTKK